MRIKGWRRLIACGVVLVVSTLLLWFGKMTSAEWTELTMWITVTYLGSDAAEKGSAAWSSRPPAQIVAAGPALTPPPE